MKKLLVFTLFVSVLFLGACTVSSNKPSSDSDSHDNDSNYYTGSDYKGNYVYGAAMNLAWNDLNDNILHEKLKLVTTDDEAQKTVNDLNQAIFTRNDLDEASYYIKSGYGQKTVDEINRESKIKFPNKSFDDLTIELRDVDIIAYAYLFKEVEYLSPFKLNDDGLSFNKGNLVKYFSASYHKQKENVSILNYESDDKFIIKLKLKDNQDELILAKGYNMSNPQLVMEEVNKYFEDKGQALNPNDKFKAPKLNLDMKRTYPEMLNKLLANDSFRDYEISAMYENIKFKMDERGAKVENEAVISLELMSVPDSVIKPKNLILDKPYWVIMKRADSHNPYFILGINNTELMELVK